MPNQPEYTYSPRGSRWCVYRMEYGKNGSVGTKIAEFATRQMARDEVYRLNGWKIKPNQK